MNEHRLASSTQGPDHMTEVSTMWSWLHGSTPFVVEDEELHYLRVTAFHLKEDDLAQLLLRKLRVAKVVPAVSMPPNVVAMNRIVEFTFGDQGSRKQRLSHPSSCRSEHEVSVASRVGAGLVGLTAGQTISWPDELGRLRELHVERVCSQAEAACASQGAGERQ